MNAEVIAALEAGAHAAEKRYISGKTAAIIRAHIEMLRKETTSEPQRVPNQGG